jgi:hypothetical protein
MFNSNHLIDLTPRPDYAFSVRIKPDASVSVIHDAVYCVMNDASCFVKQYADTIDTGTVNLSVSLCHCTRIIPPSSGVLILAWSVYVWQFGIFSLICQTAFQPGRL